MNDIRLRAYSSLDCNYLKDYILNLPKQSRKHFLENNEIRSKFLEGKNHYEFVWLVQGLKDEELKFFIDENFIDQILESDVAVDKVNAILTVENNYKNIVLNKDSVARFVCYNDSLNSNLSYISNPFLETIFKFILEQDDYNMYKLLYNFNPDGLYEILCKEQNLNQFKVKCKDYIKYFPIKKLNEFVLEEKNVAEFLELDIIDINKFIESGLKIPNVVYTNQDFIKKYLELENIEVCRSYLENLSKNNIYAYELLDELVCKKYDEEVKNLNNDGISSKFVNMKAPLDYVYHKTQKRFLDMLIDKNFLDLTNNVLINLENIIKFNEITKIIPEQRIMLYKKVINFYDLSLQEQKDLYFSLNKKYREYLYDDFRKCQDLSYDMLNDSFIDLEKLNKVDLNGVNIYELKGEPFYIPIHMTSIKRKQINEKTCVWREKLKNDTLSISVISNSLLRTYQNPKKYLAFGFNKLNKNNIMHVYHSDSYTHHSSGTQRINEIFTPRELIETTKGYNEVLFIENETLNPNYIICYDEILDEDIKLSKRMNIPIVIIHTQFYKEGLENVSAVELGLVAVPKYKKL